MLTGSLIHDPITVQVMDLAMLSAMEVSVKLQGLDAALVGLKGPKNLLHACRQRMNDACFPAVWKLTFTSGSTRSGGAPSQLTATIMAKLLESGDLQQHVFHKLQPAYQRRHHTLVSSVQKYLVPLGASLPQASFGTMGGYFVWLTLPAPLRGRVVVSRAKEEEGVILPEGSIFGVRGDAGPDLDDKLRLCFSWEAEEILVEGIQRLARVVKRIQADAS